MIGETLLFPFSLLPFEGIANSRLTSPQERRGISGVRVRIEI